MVFGRPAYDGPLILPTLVGALFFALGIYDLRSPSDGTAWFFLHRRMGGVAGILLGGLVAAVGLWRLVVG